jgi:hypothetical protein
MFQFVPKSFNYCKSVFEKCMTIKDYNSRLVFLTTSFVVHVIMLWQTFVYLHTSVRDNNYPTILAVLLGGHGVNAMGRFMTKKGEPKSDDPAPAMGSDMDKG